jgi:hypothetical protein
MSTWKFFYFSEHPITAGSSIISMASASRPGSSSEGAAGVPPPGALFEDPERVKLINKIADGLNTLKSELDTIKKFKTSYACLWLADMEKLRFLVDRHLPDDGLYEPLELYDKLCRIETKGRIGQKCKPSSSLYHYVRLTACSIQGNKTANLTQGLHLLHRHQSRRLHPCSRPPLPPGPAIRHLGLPVQLRNTRAHPCLSKRQEVLIHRGKDQVNLWARQKRRRSQKYTKTLRIL